MKLRDRARAAQPDEGTPWVERETLVEASPEEVWEALTDEDRLEEWMAPEVDPVEGGKIAVRDGDGERTGTIEALPGGSRVTVVETPIGPTVMAVGGWQPRLARLRHISRLILVA